MFKTQFITAVCAAALSEVFDQAPSLLIKLSLELGLTASECAGEVLCSLWRCQLGWEST